VDNSRQFAWSRRKAITLRIALQRPGLRARVMSRDAASAHHASEVEVRSMALTMWMNSITGERLDGGQVRDLLVRAHRLYEANSHIFEDEFDALAALGLVSPVVD
jgi:hypothetical protein